MLRCNRNCFPWNRNTNTISLTLNQTFSLPAPLPQWPHPRGQGQGFASGVVNLGEIEVCKVTTFEFVWGSNVMVDMRKAVAFYKPVGIPDSFHILGHYCQPCYKPFRGFLLVAREVETCSSEETTDICNHDKLPALRNPLDYTLVWCSNAGSKEISTGSGFFWLHQPPEGYKGPWLLGY